MLQCDTCERARFEQLQPAGTVNINGQEVPTPAQVRVWCVCTNCIILINPEDDFYCDEYKKKGEQEND